LARDRSYQHVIYPILANVEELILYLIVLALVAVQDKLPCGPKALAYHMEWSNSFGVAGIKFEKLFAPLGDAPYALAPCVENGKLVWGSRDDNPGDILKMGFWLEGLDELSLLVFPILEHLRCANCNYAPYQQWELHF
jgi:hypothetical protein